MPPKATFQKGCLKTSRLWINPKSFLKKAKAATSQSVQKLNGRRNVGLVYVATIAPNAEQTKAARLMGKTVFQSILPASPYRNELAKAAETPMTLLEPMAKFGEKPSASKAGKDINPPPPTMASTKPAKNPARVINVAE